MNPDAILYLLKKMLPFEVISGLIACLCALLLARHFWFTRTRAQINNQRDSNEALERQCRRLDRRCISLRQSLQERRANHVGRLRNILEDGSVSGLRADAELSHLIARVESQSHHLETATATQQALQDRVSGARLQLGEAESDLAERIEEAPGGGEGELAQRLRQATKLLQSTQGKLKTLEKDISSALGDIQQAEHGLSATLNNLTTAGTGLASSTELCGDATSWLATGYAAGTTELKNDDLRQRLAGCETGLLGVLSAIEESETAAESVDGAIDIWENRCAGLREKLELTGKELLEQSAKIHACAHELELRGVVFENDRLADTGNNVAGSGERLLMGEQQLAELGGELLNSRRSIFELGRSLRMLRSAFGEQSRDWLQELLEVAEIESKVPEDRWELSLKERQLPPSIASREQEGIYRLGPAPGTGVELARLRGELAATRSIPADQAVPYEKASAREAVELKAELKRTQNELKAAQSTSSNEANTEALRADVEEMRLQIEMLNDSLDARDQYLKTLKAQLSESKEAEQRERPGPTPAEQTIDYSQIAEMPIPLTERPPDVDETLGALASSEAMGNNQLLGSFFPEGWEDAGAFLDEEHISSPDLQKEIRALRQEDRGVAAALAQDLGFESTPKEIDRDSPAAVSAEKKKYAAAERATPPDRDPLLGLIYKKPIAQPDDLCRHPEVGPALAQKLNENGIYTFDQIAKWDGVAWWAWAHRLGLPKTTSRNDWLKSARALALRDSGRRRS